MKQIKSRLIILAVTTAAGGIICAIKNENAYIAIAAIALAAFYGGVAMALKIKSA